MNVDATDLEILLFFLKNGNATSSACDVVKGLYEIKDRHDMIKKTNMISYRIKKWKKKKVFHEKKERGISLYTINLESIYYGECKIEVGDDTILPFGKAIIFEMADNSYVVHFLKEN